MTIISILQYPDLRLANKARKVKDVRDPAIQKIIADMLETLANTERCAALAATQLDLPDPPSITVINPVEEGNEPMVLINPEIITASGEHKEGEGCMSVFPDDVNAPVVRAQKVKVKALDREGSLIEIEAEGFLAKCLQHEIDHLNGKIFLDRISELKRNRIEKKIGKIRSRTKDN